MPITPTTPRLSGLSIALDGMKRAETKAVEAASKIVEAGAINAAAVQDVTAISDRAQAIPDVAAENARAAAVLADTGSGDIVKPLVDLLQAKTAFAASATAAKVTADLDLDTIKIISRK